MIFCSVRHAAMVPLCVLAVLLGGMPCEAGPLERQTANKSVVRSFWTDVWAERKFNRIDELFSEDFVIHSAGKPIGPRNAFKDWVKSFFSNVDDLELEVLDIFAEEDKVITRWICRGRFVGNMFGINGRSQRIEFTGMNIMTVRDGRIVEAWVERDGLGLARQIGLVKE